MVKKVVLAGLAVMLLFTGCNDSPKTSDLPSESSSVSETLSDSSEGGDSVDAVSSGPQTEASDGNTASDAAEVPDTEVNEMKLTINGAEFSASFADTKAAEEFKAMLPLTLDMSELNGNEKYFYLDGSLTAESASVGQINSGDIMLYGSNCIVVFYDSFSTPYSYTRIGRIDDPDGLAEAVGKGSVTVDFKG